MVDLTRRYRFSAAHRLHNEALNAAENARLYGKCNNRYGHGHNYVMEVTFRGEVDRATGMVMDVAKLDTVVNREVIERYDHTHLNFDVEEFAHCVPTTENLCLEIYRRLRSKMDGAPKGAKLLRVRLEETSSNFFEYEGEDDRPATIGGGR